METGGTLSDRPVDVLHVDADTAVSEALAERVGKAENSFNIESKTEPQEALARVTTADFDCIVSEYELPNMTGIEFLNAVRENNKRVPFILFTGKGDERVASQAISAGVTDYIRKRSGQEGIDTLATRIQDLSGAGQSISETNARYDTGQFKRFLEAFPDAVFVMDEHGRYLDYITGGDRSLLYDDIDALLGQRYHDVLPDETANRFLETIHQALETGKQQQIEYKLDVKRGTRWFEARVGPLERGTEPQTVFWIARDITERKRREQEYEQIFNGVPNPIVVNDPETGELLEVNDALCEILGYEKKTIFEKGNDGLAVNAEGFTGERAANIVASVMESGEPQTFEWKLEAADGSHRVLEVTGTPAEINGEEQYISMTRDITERRQREREYEQIFDNVNDAIAVFDPANGDIVDVNEAYHEMLGYDDLETIRELGIDGLSASEEGYSGERGRDLIRAVSRSGEPETVEWRGETSGGDRLWLEATLAPAEIGGQDRVLSIQRDITERRELERTYQDIFESVSDGLIVHDPATGDILEVNERYCELTGYDREELLDRTVRQIMLDDPDYTYEEIITRIKRAREEGPQLFEFKAETKNGEIFVADVHLRTVEIRGEERVLASVRDITERKRRKQEYEQIFHGVNDIITIHDPETAELRDVNDTFCELLGYDRETILEMGITGYSPTEDGYTMEQARQFVQDVAESGEPRQTEWAVETRSGEVRWLAVKGTTVETGGDRQCVSISRDVTERKYREQRLEVFNRVLRHNLRNQLDVIRSHAEVLTDRTTDDHAEQIVAAVDELATIGARARKIDRIMSMDDLREEVSLPDTLREAVGTIESTHRDVDVTTDVPQSALLTTSQKAIRIAVQSALENAIEHAESMVTVAVEETADGYVVTIQDDGPGIPEEQLTPIEARSETNRQHSRGLGLWQLRWSVDKLNGELSFDTTDGTTVRIAIPDQGDGIQTR